MGKASTPAAPDYTKAAQQTAASNQAAAQGNVQANRVNQTTPYGSVTWTHNPTKTVDLAGYQAAVDAWNKNQGKTYVPGSGGGADGAGADGADTMDGYWTGGTPMPTQDQFMREDPNSGWSQQVTLNPQVQSIMDKYLADPNQGVMSGKSAQEEIMSRLNPQYDMQENQLRQRLANQGISAGSEAFNNDFRQFQQGRNDANLQAALQGITLDMQNRNQGLNVLQALKGLSNPSMPTVAQQATTPGVDYTGAANNQYQANLDATNAQNASSGNLMSGLFTLGGAALGSPWLGSALGASGVANDFVGPLTYQQPLGSAFNKYQLKG